MKNRFAARKRYLVANVSFFNEKVENKSLFSKIKWRYISQMLNVFPSLILENYKRIYNYIFIF